MKKVNINIPGNEYCVYAGQDIFKELIPLINNAGLSRNALFVIDENVFTLHQNIFENIEQSGYKKISTLIIKVSEPLKSRITLEKIYKKLLDEGFGRDSVLIAVGGGIVGDIAGYAAATFMRGIQFIQIPTTLLAAVDSSVGGKTGINYFDTKNIIGAFKQPALVLIDTNFFGTLPQREIVCGLGEIVKYAFLTNRKFYEFVTNNLEKLIRLDQRILESILLECVRFKGAVVEADEKESGLRKILNFGHTFAHAVEVDQKYKLKHGEAVIVGVVCALFLSLKLNLISAEQLDEFLTLPCKMKDWIKIKKYDVEKMLGTMSRDKKNRDNKIKFVLIKDIGQIIPDAESKIEDVEFAICEAMKLFQ